MNEQDIPIDIHISKLADWLTSRRHVKKDWPTSILIVRQKINNAIQDMPEHPEITKLLLGSYINYFHCLKIIEILQETERDSKNIFGWYTSQRMKDWNEIVYLYEKNNLYLAEVSQFLIRNVIYEVPSLRKQIHNLSQMQETCEKRHISHTKTIAGIKDRYATSCKQMGIKGENIEKELRSLGNNFEDNFIKVTKLCKDLDFAGKLYSDFISFTIPSSSNQKLELLKFIIEKGDTTVYEWIHKEPPVSIKKVDRIEESDEKSENTEDEINFAIEEPFSGEIKWEDTTIEHNEGEIDFDISLDDSGTGIEVESTGPTSGVAEGENAFTVLSNNATRNQFINELLELEGFLRQRKEDVKAEDNIVSMTQFSCAPKTVQEEDTESMDVYIRTISSILNELTSTKMQHLYLIRSSQSYVKRFANTISGRLNECDNLTNMINDMKRKSHNAAENHVKLSKILKDIIERTVVLQEQIEKDISSKYNNRPVNLMGRV